MTSSRRTWTGILFGAVMLLGMASCAAGPGDESAEGGSGPLPAPTFEGSEPGIPAVSAFAGAEIWPDDEHVMGWVRMPIAGWVDPGERFAVVTWGSSTCPVVVDSAERLGENVVGIAFSYPYDGICTMDLAPMTHSFSFPEGFSASSLTLSLTGEGDYEALTIPVE